MKAKHTPGPWVANIDSSYGHGQYADIMAPGRERPVAEISATVGDPFTEEDEANADLIAAAPDLYVAIQHARWRKHPHYPEACTGCAAVDAAIAKAAGGTT